MSERALVSPDTEALLDRIADDPALLDRLSDCDLTQIIDDLGVDIDPLMQTVRSVLRER